LLPDNMPTKGTDKFNCITSKHCRSVNTGKIIYIKMTRTKISNKAIIQNFLKRRGKKKIYARKNICYIVEVISQFSGTSPSK
jgi:hypothetical protein